MDIAAVLSRLEREYGAPGWEPRYDPATELIMTILSQNTSDVNSRRAFQRLRDTFESWEDVAGADVEEIAAAIQPGGLARIKAPRLKAILGQILEERGSLDLSFLGDMPLPEAKAWLRRLPGVGPKTAGCVLLFGLGRPALPVDTHVYRVSKRLGLIGLRASVEAAHDILERMVPADRVYEFHLNMIEHGRRICHAQRPLCRRCVLRDICPSCPQYESEEICRNGQD